MTEKRKNWNNAFNAISILSAFFVTFACLLLSSSVFADIPLLKKNISKKNLELQKLSLTDKTYRGEEGILRINPESAKRFGIKALINQDYLKAKKLYKEAEKDLEKACKAMSSQEKEKNPGVHAKDVETFALRHNEAIKLAWEHMMVYQSKLRPEIDDRLNEEACSLLMKKLLKREIKKSSNNLRNALGRFYNRCQGLDKSATLNSENIKFVNYIFSEFTKTAPVEAVNQFKLDIFDKKDAANSWPLWKYALGTSSSRFSSLIESAFEKNPKAKSTIDVMLFLALMRQESNYDPRNVSYVGAAGLTQIMPTTAKGLGMKEIYSPPYFKTAGSLLGKERKLKRRAKDLLLEITGTNSAELAKQAIDLMRQAADSRTKRKELYARYKKELLETKKDDRLNAQMAIEYGLKYFCMMMKIQKGDASLALASYNAGPHRVKQYNGIPPYDETIDFRNKVLKYYQIYLTRAKKKQLKENKIKDSVNQRH